MSEPRGRELSRRTVLKIGGATVAGAALCQLLAACNIDSGGSNNNIQGSVGRVLASQAPLPEAFRARLPVPPALEPVRRDGSTDGQITMVNNNGNSGHRHDTDCPSTPLRPNRPSTPDATTNPPADHQAPQEQQPDLQSRRSGYSDVPRHHTVGLTGFEPATP